MRIASVEQTDSKWVMDMCEGHHDRFGKTAGNSRGNLD